MGTGANPAAERQHGSCGSGGRCSVPAGGDRDEADTVSRENRSRGEFSPDPEPEEVGVRCGDRKRVSLQKSPEVTSADLSMDDRAQRCVTLTVQPCRGLVDDTWGVRVHNAPPCAPMTLHALHSCEDGHRWEAFGHYSSDASGNIDVGEDLCLGGTYSGQEPMGLLWSLRPVPGSKPGLRLRKVDVQVPLELRVSVFPGHRSAGFPDQESLVTAVVQRWYIAPGVHRVPITEGGLTATLFLPPGPGPFPGVLDLWGGGGKLVEYRASLLASHGFAALALDYLTCKVTVETGKLVDDQYFEAAYRVLQQHPQVLGSRLAMVGLSLGTSITLKMAAYSEVMKFRCVVCISGSHVQPVGGSLTEILTYFDTNGKKITYNEEKQAIVRTILMPIPSDPSLKVDVGQLQCPLLLLVGEDDQNWPAMESAMDMKAMMERSGNSHLLTILSYPNTGHLIEPPYSPHIRFSNFVWVGQPETQVLLWGGEAAAHAHGQEDAWRKMLVFLREKLFAERDPGSPASLL